MTFEYRDPATCDTLVAQPDTDDDRKPVVFISTTGLNKGVYVPLDRVEEVVAGIRDAARQTGQQPELAVCRHPEGYESECPCPLGCVCCKVAPVDPTTADGPVQLRWGLGDVLHGDDDTTIICLSGPHREPYWLGLEPERAAALRDDLAPPTAGLDASQPATDQARPPREQWRVEIYDPLAKEWAPGVAFSDRARAAERLDAVPTYSPRWGIDTPPQRRLVRETTTWTVEEDETR
ncbi:hypothetical protein PUR59_00230 [Streptomyces sp. SP18ES09]|uniref:hypothetical protein n=1 Tax=Streptomyces sp. SP18ES09 TaxID=3002532 RepID=UPI002E78F0C5|nr:hypothetical protein [Streptomyces sp. SP18ES09]MEE1813485.1 hypothetical protein [Streptomyces sp. SP18ES09]